MRWKSHGTPLTAQAEILYSNFVVIAIDNKPEEISGCSKDALTHKIKEIGNTLSIDFFENGNTYYLENDQVYFIKFNLLKEAVKSKSIAGNTSIFNLVETIEDLNTKWLAPAEKTWLKRYFNSNVVA